MISSEIRGFCSFYDLPSVLLSPPPMQNRQAFEHFSKVGHKMECFRYEVLYALYAAFFGLFLMNSAVFYD